MVVPKASGGAPPSRRTLARVAQSEQPGIPLGRRAVQLRPRGQALIAG
jgi:hypothetical protein